MNYQFDLRNAENQCYTISFGGIWSFKKPKTCFRVVIDLITNSVPITCTYDFRIYVGML